MALPESQDDTNDGLAAAFAVTRHSKPGQLDGGAFEKGFCKSKDNRTVNVHETTVASAGVLYIPLFGALVRAIERNGLIQ